MREQTHKQVLVTGGSGYVAGWMIVGLLKAGYSVRTTLRDRKQQASVKQAIEQETGTSNLLSFVEANLLSDTGWDDAIEGMQYVLHVASPMGQNRPKADLVRPAREGTLRVLSSASRHGVQRVVCTSSTVTATLAPRQSGSPSDERVWTDVLQKSVSEYARSKTLAEQAAWDFIDKDKTGMTLTTVLPGMILGRVLYPKVSGSVELIYRLLTGKMPALPKLGFAVSETEALVDLHIRAMTAESAANQRFLGVGDFLWIDDMATLLRERYPENVKIPTRHMPDFFLRAAALFSHEARFMAPMLNRRTEFSSRKSGDLLGWYPPSSRQAVLSCAESLLQQGVV